MEVLIMILLIASFFVGIISSTLLVASIYLYRESRRTVQTEDEGKKRATESSAAVACERQQQQQPQRQNLDDSTENKFSFEAEPINQYGDKLAVISYNRSCSGENSSSGSSCCCSYTCDVCGSCCPSDEHKSLEARSGQTSCQQPPPYPCGELFLSGVDVGFKCQIGGDSGTFFFYRGRQTGGLLEPIRPSNRYAIFAALASVPYHLWFCPDTHANKSQRCGDCSHIFSFELCDSEVQFQHGDSGKKCSSHGVWLLACEEAAGRNNVIYRGDASCLSRLHYTGKLFVYFGLPYEAGRGLSPAAAEAAATTEITIPVGSAPMPGHEHHLRVEDRALTAVADDEFQGDSPKSSMVSPKQRRPRSKNVNRERLNDNTNTNEEADTNLSNKNSPRKTGAPSARLLSIDTRRKTVKWPITQIESLIESSSSDDGLTDDRVQKTADSVSVGMQAAGSAADQEKLNLSNIVADHNVFEGDRFSIQLDNLENN